jgi:acetolactate synthase I/II/III large subunit
MRIAWEGKFVMDVEEPAFAPATLTSRQPTRAADVIVDTLIAHGVELMFGLPGGPISPVFDALIDRPSVRLITTRHESGALFGACGYARTTGKLGVALVTSGPGAFNALSGLASAYCDGLPVLLLVGEVARKNYGRGALQDGSSYGLQMVEILKRVTKTTMEVHDPQRAPALLRAAIQQAMTGPQGPVALTLPIDVLLSPLTMQLVARNLTGAPSLSPTAIDECKRLLRDPGRVAIFAGSGVRGVGGPEGLIRFAERMQAPVMTTPKGKGVFPEEHRLSLGVFGMGGHSSASDYLAGGIDTLVAVGTSLSEIATEGWSTLIKPRRALIHVDIDERQLGRAYPYQLGIVAPAELFLERMSDVLPQAPRRSFGIQRHVLPEGRRLVAPQRALAELQSIVPSDTIFTIDSGEHFLFATHFLQTSVPDGFIAMTGLGSMGQSIGAAIGVQIAKPERTVVAICGDGCFAMNALEVATAVAEQVPIIVVVINDGRLGMVEIGQENVYGRKPMTPASPMDVAQLARALGAQSLIVDGPGQLEHAALMRMRLEGPVVIDVRIDPSVRMPKKERFSGIEPRERPRMKVAVN